MDEVSVEAMLTEAGVKWTNACILFQHLKQFFGRSLYASEEKCQAYFGNNDLPPVLDHEVLPDITFVSYWWKQPNKLLKHQISDMISPPDLEGLTHVDVCTGGDHEVSRFQLLLKVLSSIQADLHC
jgi:hypothetical protein